MAHNGTRGETRFRIIAAAFAGVLTLSPLGGLGAATVQDAIALYKQGEFENAAPILERLANAGDPVASFWLGSMWHQGRGKPVNFRTAHHLYRMAAYHGNADAQNNLALLYRDGRGVEENSIVSYAWFSLAAARDNTVAKRNLSRLSDRMTATKILEGQQLASEYLEWISAARKGPVSGTSIKLATAPTRVNTSRGKIVLVSTNSSGVSNQPAAKVGTDQFIVQLGLFRSTDGIARLERKLGKQGVDFIRKTVTIRGTSYQRFRIGPFNDSAAARDTARRINKILKINSAVIPVPS